MLSKFDMRHIISMKPYVGNLVTLQTQQILIKQLL